LNEMQRSTATPSARAAGAEMTQARSTPPPSKSRMMVWHMKVSARAGNRGQARTQLTACRGGITIIPSIHLTAPRVSRSRWWLDGLADVLVELLEERPHLLQDAARIDIDCLGIEFHLGCDQGRRAVAKNPLVEAAPGLRRGPRANGLEGVLQDPLA